MADREFTLNVRLTANNDTDRAFAAAEGNIEVYNRLLEEQAAKSDVVVRANQRLAKSHKDVAEAQNGLAQGYPKILSAQADYGKAVEAQARAESAYRRGDIRSADNLVQARKRVETAQASITKAIKETEASDAKFDAARSRRSSSRYAQIQKENAAYKEQSRLFDQLATKTSQLGKETDARRIATIRNEIDAIGISLRQVGAHGWDVNAALGKAFDTGRQSQFAAAQARVNASMAEYQKLVDSVAKSEKLRDETNRSLGGDTSQHRALREKLDVDVLEARAHLTEFRATERAHAISIPVHLDDANIRNAREILNSLDVTRRRGGGTAQPKVGPGTNDPYGLTQLGKSAQGVQKSATGLAQSFTHILSAFSPALIQPVIVLMTGMAAAMASIGSAALAAGTAMSTVFLSSIAEGVPVMGLFGAAMQRLQGVMGLVSAQLALQQQRFMAQYQAAYQNSLGINQIVIAQHQYSDALYSQNIALYQVKVAELGLLSARQQATRQLEQLVFQETNARLAAEASSLAVSEAQKNLQAAIATGGDVQQAQLQLQQAQVSHHQAVIQARNAITDASRGSIARRGIQQQVTQAEQAVTQARRAVVDADFAARQARAAIIQAQQAQAGFNIATAAQMAYLRSQMTQTERVLAGSILRVFGLFRGAHGILTPMTDAILRPFVRIADEIYRILHEPRVLRSLQGLASAIGQTIGTVSKVFLSSGGVNTFISIVQAATRNMRPLASIISNIFTIMGRVIQAAGPEVHKFAQFLSNLIGQFSNWTSTNRGKNWLKQWFDDAFNSLKAFIRLGVALGRLLAAIVGVGGGAQSGINTLGQLTGAINRITDSINRHGKAWRDLQGLWSAVMPTLRFVGQILRAVGDAFLRITSTKQGQQSLKALGDIISKILIPAFAEFITGMGRLTVAVGNFLDKHPQAASAIKDFLVIFLTAGAAIKIFHGLISPITKLVGLVASLAKFSEAFRTAVRLLGLSKIFGRFISDESGSVGGKIKLSIEEGGISAGRKIRTDIIEGGTIAADEIRSAMTGGPGRHGGGGSGSNIRKDVTTAAEGQVAKDAAKVDHAAGEAAKASSEVAKHAGSVGKILTVGGEAVRVGGKLLSHVAAPLTAALAVFGGISSISKHNPVGHFAAGVINSLNPLSGFGIGNITAPNDTGPLWRRTLAGDQALYQRQVYSGVSPAQAMQNVINVIQSQLSGLTSSGRQALLSATQTWAQTLTEKTPSLKAPVKDFVDFVNTQTGKLPKGFKDSFNNITEITSKAFDYINKTVNSDLRAFGAKPAHVHVGAPPHFAEGGYVGNKGERGDDVVHAMLGRGEAVLNYAHQRVVEPAMRAFYGWGLGDMFGKVRGSHGQGRGYSTGGYVYPFPPGTQIGRTDQGIDADLPVGAPIGPMGRARVMGRIANWYQGQPYIWWQLLDGIRKGAYAYVAEQITNLAPIGSLLNANDAVARYAASGTGIEYGWATANGSTLARAQSGVGGGAVSAAGESMRAFVSGLAHGRLISGGALGMASSASSALGIPQIRDLAVRGSGALADVLRHAVKRVTKVANEFLGASGGGAGAGSVSASGIAPGSWMRVARQIARRMGWGPSELRAWQGVENIEDSSYSLTAQNPTSKAYGLAQGITGPGWYYGYGGNPHTLVGQLVAMANYMKGRYGSPIGALAHEHAAGWYNQGGYVGKAMPIIAHAGEWVVNKAQQHGLARRLGTSVGGLKGSLGFTGGPHSFAGGGEVGGAIAHRMNYDPYQGGTYTAPGSFGGDYSVAFYIPALQAYQQAQGITQRLQATGSLFRKGLNQFIRNWNLVSGDNGIFSLAAQALSNFTNQQSAVVQLAASGFRTSSGGLLTRIRRGPQTALEAARTAYRSLNQVIDQTNTLASNYRESLSATRREISRMFTNGRRNTNFDQKRYDTLVGARTQLYEDIQAQDQNLANDYSQRLQNAQNLFQANYQQILRGTGTLRGRQFGQVLAHGISNLRNIGPAIASGLVSTAQTIAQTMGNYGALVGHIDNDAITVAQRQRADLQDAYNKAAKRARRDPRWQSVADDLLSQLESATTAVVQAQAQAMTDAITQVQNSQTIQQAAFQMASTLNQAIAATASAVGFGNQTTAAAQNISLNAGNTTALQGQLAQYQGLLGTATAQGNQGAVQQLTQAIDDLTGQIASSIVATQQAVTAYNQLSVNIQSSTSSASSGFIQSASGIITTLGQITGSLNLPQQIQTLQQYGQGLAQQASDAVTSIQNTITGAATGGQSAFGAAAGTANSYLAQAANAFNQGPQAYASWLAANSQGLASFQAGLPPDEQALFNGLIQALTDNTTAVVTNNLNLQNLNATSNQQQFSSAAWQQFRTAIFNGIGGLLPQYAMQVPSLDVGGTLTSNGLIYGHRGEMITPANVVKSQTSSAPMHQEIHNHFTEPMEIADPVHISNRIAWTINHSPNSR